MTDHPETFRITDKQPDFPCWIGENTSAGDFGWVAVSDFPEWIDDYLAAGSHWCQCDFVPTHDPRETVSPITKLVPVSSELADGPCATRPVPEPLDPIPVKDGIADAAQEIVDTNFHPTYFYATLKEIIGKHCVGRENLVALKPAADGAAGEKTL